MVNFNMLDDELVISIIKEAKKYNAKQEQLFINEYGWQDWMEGFCSDLTPKESELDLIDNILSYCFKLAQSEV